MRRIVILFLVCLCCSVSYGQDIRALSEQIARFEEEIRQNEQLLRKISGDRTTTQQELSLVRSRISTRQQLVRSLERQIGALQSDINAKDRRIRSLSGQIETLRRDYARMVYADYKNYLTNNELAFLFASRDFADVTRRRDYIRRYNRLREEKAAEIMAASVALSREVSELNSQKSQLDLSRTAGSRELSTLRQDEKTYDSARARLAAEEKNVQNTIKQKQEERNRAQQRLQRLIEDEARRSSATPRSESELRRIEALSAEFDKNQGRLPYPVQGGVVIDKFGRHRHPTQPNLFKVNNGVDIAGERGAPVRSVFEGEVAAVFFDKSLGNGIIIRHGEYFTVYTNLARVSVSEGDRVRTMQLLGSLPATDDNNDYYLHFELWKGTTFLDPEKWISK